MRARKINVDRKKIRIHQLNIIFNVEAAGLFLTLVQLHGNLEWMVGAFE